MNENVTKLEYQGKNIFLVATAHVSQESVELVKKVVEEEQPDSICIELDEARYQNIKNPKKWEDTNIVQIIKTKKVGFLLANLVLASYQKKIAGKLKTSVGGEMLQGIECAEKTGATLVLADRNIQTTFMRIWRKMGFFKKLKLILSLLFSFQSDQDELSEEDIQELLKKDMLDSAMSDLKKDYPEIGEILIHERDQYLANKIKNAPGQTIVAILGAAHVKGVAQELFKEQNMEEISYIPKKGKGSKIIGWIVPAIIIGLLIYAFYLNIQTGLQQLTTWVLWNSVFAGLGTLAALGHPLSILTAFVLAPFTSLNPLLACGWFAGLVEANVRKPTVKDLQNLSEDAMHFKQFYKNRFLKTLLVVIFANVGSTIGTIVAGIDIAKNLF